MFAYSLDGHCASDGVMLSELGFASILAQVIEGLLHLASMGVLHLDIKPANLLLSGLIKGAEAKSTSWPSESRSPTLASP